MLGLLFISVYKQYRARTKPNKKKEGGALVGERTFETANDAFGMQTSFLGEMNTMTGNDAYAMLGRVASPHDFDNDNIYVKPPE